MPIEAISSINSTPAAVQGADYLDLSTDELGSKFGTQLTSAVDSLQAMNGEKDALAMEAITGDLDDIHRATIASARSSATLELFAAIRNKGVDAFNEIMRMQA